MDRFKALLSATSRQPGARPSVAAPPASQNAEIFTLTYGSMVRQLIADYEDVEEVNKQLDKMCGRRRHRRRRRPAAGLPLQPGMSWQRFCTYSSD